MKYSQLKQYYCQYYDFFQVGLGELLKEKIKKFPRYKDIKGMWLDADWSTEENWAWRDVVKPFNGM